MEEKKTVYAARIVNVMETWPLQMSLEVDGREVQAMVSAGAKVVEKEAGVEAGEASLLVPGMLVRVEGTLREKGDRFCINAVEILGRAPLDKMSGQREQARSSEPNPDPPPPKSSQTIPMKPSTD